MLTIKHVESNYEGITPAKAVSFYPKGQDNQSEPMLLVFGAPQPLPTAPGETPADGCDRYTTGTVYVMNESGRTVGTYHLGLQSGGTP